jgi:hypothetical protein
VLFAVRPSAASIAAILGLVHAGASIVAHDVGGGDALFAARMRLVAAALAARRVRGCSPPAPVRSCGACWPGAA